MFSADIEHFLITGDTPRLFSLQRRLSRETLCNGFLYCNIRAERDVISHVELHFWESELGMGPRSAFYSYSYSYCLLRQSAIYLRLLLPLIKLKQNNKDDCQNTQHTSPHTHIQTHTCKQVKAITQQVIHQSITVGNKSYPVTLR